MAIATQTLLSNGYFPKELPPTFNSAGFASYVVKSGPLQLTSPTGGRNLITRPALHNLARPNGQRRRLHIPNPFSYYSLCDLLSNNWKAIERHWSKSKLSVSQPVADVSGMRALKTESEGIDLVKHRARIRRAGRFIVKTDISRFYSSIYTHSIPWALEGKAHAKKERRGGFANELDARMRALQDGQTLGIPTGPDASVIVAEIIGASLDQQLQQAKITGMRFVDDYELVFPSRVAADAGLATLEGILAEFELAINTRKTAIYELPVELDRRWVAEIRNYEFADKESVKAEELIEYFNKAFELKSQNPHDPVLGYAVARLRAVEADEWGLLQDLVSQCAVVEHGAMEALVTHFEKNRDRGISDALDHVIADILNQGASLTHGSELAWALWAAIWFRRPIPTRVAKKLDGNPDSVVALLALHAKSLGLIKKGVTFPLWSSLMRRSSLYDSSWLLAYEADVHGWLPSAEKPNHVDSDPNFSQLKNAGVSFYDTTVTAPTKVMLLDIDSEPSSPG